MSYKTKDDNADEEQRRHRGPQDAPHVERPMMSPLGSDHARNIVTEVLEAFDETREKSDLELLLVFLTASRGACTHHKTKRYKCTQWQQLVEYPRIRSTSRILQPLRKREVSEVKATVYTSSEATFAFITNKFLLEYRIRYRLRKAADKGLL